MVSLPTIQASNAEIKSLPPNLVAIFVGATNGVGETTVRQFATHAVKPRVYIVGRSREAGERIVKECQALNAEGTFVFLQKEMQLMRNVDEVCEDIERKEEGVNLLVLSVGTLQNGIGKSMGFHWVEFGDAD